MKDSDFQAKLGDLLQQIDHLPEDERGRLQNLANEAGERHQKMKRTIAELQESLDYLRLSIKYLVFDLEATRRENEYLRKLIEAQQNGQNESGEP